MEKERIMLEFIYKIKCLLRGVVYQFFGVRGFRKIGCNFKVFGSKGISAERCSVGDNCWFQAVHSYKGVSYSPCIKIGRDTMFSSNVHISAVSNINIGDECLFGSNIYVGDHSHGSTKLDLFDNKCAPALKTLDDIADIYIGDRVWVGDGVVILAGTHIGSNSVVAANSVVKGIFTSNSLIAGIPANKVRSYQ